MGYIVLSQALLVQTHALPAADFFIQWENVDKTYVKLFCHCSASILPVAHTKQLAIHFTIWQNTSWLPAVQQGAADDLSDRLIFTRTVWRC